MLIQFTVGVSIFAHDVVTINLWLETKHDIMRENKILRVFLHKPFEIFPRYKEMQVKYPVGFI